MLVAGVTVAGADDLGVDKDGKKNIGDIIRYIGRHFGQRGEAGLFVGEWGTNLLLSLPVFGLDDDDVLRLTPLAGELMGEALAAAIKKNPLLSPMLSEPTDWTRIRKGGLPPDHWASGRPFVREHHQSIENAVKYAIDRRQMNRVLEAINSLQRVPFCINEPVLKFILAYKPPQAPEPESPPLWQRRKFKEHIKAKTNYTAFRYDTAIAEALLWERFWVPLEIEFRGRVCPIPYFNFAKEDRTRALFLFADGEPIGEEGLRWLKAHVASTGDGN
jgi:DNA-directed RNA polymerase